MTSPRGTAGASAPQSRHPFTDNVHPVHWFIAHAHKPTLADKVASVIRDPVIAYSFGIVSGAAATVVAAFVWSALS